ncbi:4-hydroxy-tetrahydrodipicolinate synthase [Caldifermentibacillus hisashii]|uniref:4-hydroxy-tetrahydrodipicolinate synthase n=1 Tax=Caldifermentibacillus hisashii TaxID=996558 RepID=UPI0031B7ADCF
MSIFGRISTAMVTPFDAKGNIDFQKTSHLVEYLLKNGSDSLVISGTTGESPTLTFEEKAALFKHVVNVVDKRVPVIAGTGNYNTKDSIELTKKAEDIGVDAILLVAPYYNKPNQEGLYQHFKAIAESTSLPVMIYNIPGRSSVNIEPETIIRLSEVPNIKAVKEASGNLVQMTQIIANTPDDFVLYCGDDSLALPTLSIGGVGVVSVAAHIIGNEMQQMIQAFFSGNVTEAAKWHQKLLPIMKGLFAAPSPAPVKTALQLKGLNVGSVRLPLVPLTEKERNKLAELLKTLDH